MYRFSENINEIDIVAFTLAQDPYNNDNNNHDIFKQELNHFLGSRDLEMHDFVKNSTSIIFYEPYNFFSVVYVIK